MRFFNWLRDWKRTPKSYRRPARRPAMRFAPKLELLEGRDLPSAALVTDAVNPISSEPAGFADVNGTLFFAAGPSSYVSTVGRELWKSDGTADGTVLVKDILPGARVSSYPGSLTALNGMLYFTTAYNDTYGSELWRSDGTEAGTVVVKDIRPGSNSSSPTNLINVNGTLYFSADDGVYGRELWRSDGTEAGTFMVRFTGSPSNFTNVNGTLYFTASGALWKSDGTTAGTVTLRAGLASELSNVNGTLFFTLDDFSHGRELWKSDGTAAGTVMVKDIRPGGTGSLTFQTGLTNVNGTAYFIANDGVSGQELWKSDGTDAGTVLVRDITPGVGSTPIFGLASSGGRLYFQASDGVTGRELWTSDGTEVGTLMLKDINPGSADSYPAYFFNLNGADYFTASDGQSRDLWKTDGTAAGTVVVKDFNRGGISIGSTTDILIASMGDTLYFKYYDTVIGTELWKSDGTADGTLFVKDIDPRIDRSPSTDPRDLTDVDGKLFFSGNGTLSVTDGTVAGTNVLQGTPSYYNPSPLSLTNVNGTLFYSASTSAYGSELWKSDGTVAGTMMVKDIRPGIGSANPSNLTNVNGTLFFTAYNPPSGTDVELWKSDGTEAGTVMVKDIILGNTGSFPTNLTNVNGTLYFTVDDGVHGKELWKSDGTEAGTVMVKDINPVGGSPIQSNLTNVDGTLYFTIGTPGASYNDTLDADLWKSDGTEVGTVLVKHIGTIGFASNPNPGDLTSVNGTLFFSADDGTHGVELWKSDGTPAETMMVEDLNPGSGSSYPRELTNANGTLYFAAEDGVHGRPLWKSDGTSVGTVLVKEFDNYSSDPRGLSNVDGQLFFRAGTGETVWTSDGTAEGTFQVANLFPGYVYPTDPSFTASGGSAFFSAFDGVPGDLAHGIELWRISQFARDDSAKTPESAPVQIDVLANDFTAAGSLPIVSVTQPVHGSTVANADGTVTYTPAAGFNGLDSFTYTVTNRFGDVDTATVTVKVFLPVAIDVKPGSATNAISLNNDGEIVVNLFSSANFDATTVDIATVLFAGAGVKSYAFEDVNSDGRLDLVLHFRIDETNLREVYSQLLLADADDGTLDSTKQQTILLLSGSTTDGKLWEGLDSATLFESGQTLKDLLIALGLK